jgi:hypothetical protein
MIPTWSAFPINISFRAPRNALNCERAPRGGKRFVGAGHKWLFAASGPVIGNSSKPRQLSRAIQKVEQRLRVWCGEAVAGLCTVLIHDTWRGKSPSNSQPSRSLPLSFGRPKALIVPRDFCHDCTRSWGGFPIGETNGLHEERSLNGKAHPGHRALLCEIISGRRKQKTPTGGL